MLSTVTLILAVVHGVILLIVLGNLVYLAQSRRRAPLPSYPSLSVLIPARNEEENLKRLLPTLQAQDYPEFEVVIVDDRSEDGTWTVIQHFADTRFRPVQGSGPPVGWVGKVHALFQATRHATKDLYLFLDADACLEDAGALRRLVERYHALPERCVLTGFTRLRGGGKLLVSLVPQAILGGLPWFLVRRARSRAMAALNGQCWLLPAEVYHRFEPHQSLPDEVLEDVEIGRFLKERGYTTLLVDVQDDVSVYMYEDFGSAWQGFRKNAYLLLGGHPLFFLPLLVFFALIYVLAPFFSPWLLLPIYLNKLLTDRAGRFPIWISLLAPLSLLLGTVLQLHSAVSHWTGTVSWKGRRVGK